MGPIGFDIRNNPFFLIDAPIDAGPEFVVDRCHDAVIEGRIDEAAAARVQQSLIPPRSRLTAEVGWFADMPPEGIDALRDAIVYGTLEDGVAAARAAPPLARANAAAHLKARFPGSVVTLAVLLSAWNKVEGNAVHAAITSARIRAGMPRPEADHLDEALRVLQATHARQAVKGLETLREPGKALSQIVEDAIERGALGSMLRVIVRDYDRASEPKLMAVREQIDAEIARCLSAPYLAGEVAQHLSNLLHTWDDINQPVQLLEQAEGHEEERSRLLCRDLRNFAVWLANDHFRHRDALTITKALLHTFPELDSVATGLREDVRVLEDIIGRLPLPARRPPVRSTGAAATTGAKDHLATQQSSGSGARALLVLAVLAAGIWAYFANVGVDPRSTTPARVATQSTPPTVPRTAPPAATPSEVAPAPGVGRAFTNAEIRYCVFQGVRLDHLRPLARSNAEIDRFNLLIRDFNSRCGSYRHRPGALAPIESEARLKDADLRRDAADIAAGWRQTSFADNPRSAPSSAVSNAPTTSPTLGPTAGARSGTPIVPPSAVPGTRVRPQPAAPTAPDSGLQTIDRSTQPALSPQTVTAQADTRDQLLSLRNNADARVVQTRLQALGYYTAVIDGQFGAMSVAALRAFKRDNPQLPADDIWDIATQRALLSP